MALLKKIRGTTLIETLISSVIIIAVFVVGSISLNNVFYTAVVNDDFSFRNKMKELHYLTLHNKITLPYYEETNEWEFIIEQRNENTIISGTLRKQEQTSTIIVNGDR